MRFRKTLALSLLMFGCITAVSAQALPSYNVARNKVFVAGISSGAFMAVQMHIAYSSTFKGAAIYAGGPYYCAQDDLVTALSTCMAVGTNINTAALVANVQNWAQQGLVDPVKHLKRQPVYLWSGKLDALVRQPVMDALQSFYKALGTDVFKYDNSFLAAHGWESFVGTEPCAKANTPYVLLCTAGNDSVSGDPAGSTPYDSEQVWLTRWLGRLKPANTGTLTGQLLPFNQDTFAPGGSAAAISMGPLGYVYVPRDCAAGAKCGLLLVLHGCNQSYTSVGSRFINTAGVNQWADTNRLLVLYPQAIATSATGSNPQGCWDWWGYLNDRDYAQKSGPQMQILFAMVKQLARGINPEL